MRSFINSVLHLGLRYYMKDGVMNEEVRISDIKIANNKYVFFRKPTRPNVGYFSR